jgi:hypothetical protein
MTDGFDLVFVLAPERSGNKNSFDKTTSQKIPTFKIITSQ